MYRESSDERTMPSWRPGMKKHSRQSVFSQRSPVVYSKILLPAPLFVLDQAGAGLGRFFVKTLWQQRDFFFQVIFFFFVFFFFFFLLFFSSFFSSFSAPRDR